MSLVKDTHHNFNIIEREQFPAAFFDPIENPRLLEEVGDLASIYVDR